MCNPMAVALVGMAVSAGGAYYQSQEQNAHAQDLATQQQNNANLAAQADYQAIEAEQGEIQTKATRDRLARIRQGMRERAKLRLSAGDAGVQGASIGKQQTDSYNDQGWGLDALDSNAASALAQNRRGSFKTFATNQSRINESSAQQRANSVSQTAAGFQVAGSGIGGASSGYSLGNQLFVK